MPTASYLNRFTNSTESSTDEEGKSSQYGQRPSARKNLKGSIPPVAKVPYCLFLIVPNQGFKQVSLPSGGGFEWDDDFSSPEPSAFLSKAATDLAVSKTLSPLSTASHYFSPPPPGGRTPEPSWSSSNSNYSRFSISPASIASFSLTHLTDSDTEQGGKWECTNTNKLQKADRHVLYLPHT